MHLYLKNNIVTTYSLSVAIVVLSRKNKYHLQDFASLGSLTQLWFLWNANTNYFDSIRIESFPLIIIIPFRIILPLLYVLQKVAISRENSPNALITRDTRKTLNCLILCKKSSKDVTLNHNGSSISDPSAIAEVFNNYFSNIESNLDRDIPYSNISPWYFLGAPLENSFFCPPPLIVKK